MDKVYNLRERLVEELNLDVEYCIGLVVCRMQAFFRAIQWFYLMRANKKEKYERALIGVLGTLYTIFNRTIFFVFGAIKNNF